MTPPLTKLGSSPSSSRPVMIMPVDVVLPCAPATDTRRWPAMSQARACERCSTGSPRSRASWYSGLSCHSAPVTTTRVGVADVGGVVADRDLGAEVAQGGDVRRVAHVGAGDAVPGAEEQAGDAAHARAADADEVHGAELGGDLGGEVGLDGHVRRFFLGASMAVGSSCGGCRGIRSLNVTRLARRRRHPRRARRRRARPCGRCRRDGRRMPQRRPCARRGRGRRGAGRARAAPRPE